MLTDDLNRSEAVDHAPAALDEHIRVHCCLSQVTAGNRLHVYGGLASVS